MATRTRSKPARRTPARRPPRRAVTVTLGPVGPRPTGSHSRRHRSTWGTVLRWGARWSWRASSWTSRQAAAHAAGHARRIHQDHYRPWRDQRAEYGFGTPVVWNLITDAPHNAHAVTLDAPTGGDPEVRAEHALIAAQRRERADWRAIHNMLTRHRDPPWWELLLDGLGFRAIDREAYALSQRARDKVLDQYAMRVRLAAPPVAPPASGSPGNGGRPSLVTVPADPNDFAATPFRRTRTRGDGSMANSIRTWADLADPGIDPMEFLEELPIHFAEVESLVSVDAGMIQGAAESEAKAADIFAGYVEYMNAAGIDPSVLAHLVDANELINNAVTALRQAQEAMDAAADKLAAAQQAAEAAYSDIEMPRFDRANAG